MDSLEQVRASSAQFVRWEKQNEQFRRAQRQKVLADYLQFIQTIREADAFRERRGDQLESFVNKLQALDSGHKDQEEEAQGQSPRAEINLEIAQQEALEEEPRLLRIVKEPSDEDQSNLASSDGSLVEFQNDEQPAESQPELGENLSQDPAEELKEEEAKQEASSDENSEQSEEEQTVRWSDKKFGLHLDLDHLTFLAESVMQPQNDEETTEEILRAIIEAISPLGRDDSSEEEDVEALFQPQDRQKLDISDRFSAGIKKLFQKFNTNN